MFVSISVSSEEVSSGCRAHRSGIVDGQVEFYFLCHLTFDNEHTSCLQYIFNKIDTFQLMDPSPSSRKAYKI